MNKAIGGSLAVLSGVSVCAGAAYAVDSIPPPRFSLDGQKFDQTHFKGRVFKMISNFDPTTLLASDAAINESKLILEKYAKGDKTVTSLSNTELWAYRKLKESAVHPDTKEIIPKPFRMAGYVPLNGPVCVFMMSATTTPTLLFWHWINQSQNAMVNYYNRNSSAKPQPGKTVKEFEREQDINLMMSYVAAVGAAVTVAFGVSTFVMKKFPGEKGTKLLKFVSFPSCIVASCSNAAIMRNPERSQGITVMDKEMNPIEPYPNAVSYAAANKAVDQTIISRALLQFPCYFVPPVLLSFLPISNPASSFAALAFLSISSFGLGLPMAIAYFPVISTISAEDLEDEFKPYALKCDSKLYYNKGM